MSVLVWFISLLIVAMGTSRLASSAAPSCGRRYPILHAPLPDVAASAARCYAVSTVLPMLSATKLHSFWGVDKEKGRKSEFLSVKIHNSTLAFDI
jgi:hypothetical protein